VSEKAVIRWANVLMYTIMVTVLLAMLHNAYFNKNLNVTTPCTPQGNNDINPRPVWEILGYGSNVSQYGLVREDINEYERLMQSCLSWQHNYNFLNFKILPAIGALFIVLLMKMFPDKVLLIIKNFKKQIREEENNSKNKKPPTYGFK